MLEASTLEAARSSLGRYPICNMDRVESSLSEECGRFVRVGLCDGLQFPVTLDALSKQLGGEPLGTLREWVESSPMPAATPEDLDADRPAAVAATEVADHSMILQEHVGIWSAEKMRSIVDLCGRLTRKKMRTKSTVQTFEAPCREAPLPHTWGEVALIQARIVAGSWYPAQQARG